MRKLVAIKHMSYATRHFRPGEDFETRTDRDARILIAAGRAKPARIPGKIAPPPAEVVQKVVDPVDDSLSDLRAEYQSLVGKKAYHGWDAAELQRRIDEALAS